MLKKIIINNKKVPVPVPVRTLREAIVWVESTLVPAGHMITRVVLNEILVTEHSNLGASGKSELTDTTKLEFQIDSPAELTAQTLDAMRNLASAISAGLKTLAVTCWQARGTQRPKELDSISQDLNLICELLEHIKGLIDSSYPEMAAIQGIAGLMRRVLMQVTMARANSDWKACARLLLNRLEPLLQDLTSESEGLQHRLLSQAEADVANVGTGKT